MSMEANEAFERFVEGLKKAASRCREMGTLQKNRTWSVVATHLDAIRAKGEVMYRLRAQTRSEVLETIKAGMPDETETKH